MLSDYAKPTVDVSFVEPFATRLLRLLDHFQGRVVIDSGRRSTAQQQVLYDAREEYLKDPAKWVAEHPGQPTPNLAAVPGTSEHEKGRAADLERTDPNLTWGEVHYTAHAFGLEFPIPNEDWHTQPIADWTDPAPPEDDDMDDAQMRTLAGYIAEALDARPRKTHSYRDGSDYETNARTMEEWRQEEIQQATLAAQGEAPK